ncbi:precorrin-3B synthase [Corynebacterium sp. HS2168-gen11]|uniref:precorrin-3B synthase n=1 Tax=Corynebacterium sp. HS2168-gen11 TaxID=2974027 RepID=UPI00216B0149|nr:precorrin-3B synthase [Corynebacterium sp. HS2168-gen11]MCS4535068.1 precorrin-3B synthase [Corynebacterium sp. HS2168-gen11]
MDSATSPHHSPTPEAITTNRELYFPGGRIMADTWEALSELAASFGDGTLVITKRGNLQIAGIHDEPAFQAALKQLNLTPAAAQQHTRSILLSPFALEYDHVITQLDQRLRQHSELATLSARTTFGFDAGTGEIALQHLDFGAIALAESFRLILGGSLTTLHCTDSTHVPEVLTQAALLWHQHKGAYDRIHEAPSIRDNIIDALSALTHVQISDHTPQLPSSPVTIRPIGWFDQPDGTVSLGAGFQHGRMSARMAQLLAAIGAPTTITPWSSLVIHQIAEGDAEAVAKICAPMGFIFDAASSLLDPIQ